MKNIFKALVLNKAQARWFIDYLKGKNRDERIEKRRKELLNQSKSNQ